MKPGHTRLPTATGPRDRCSQLSKLRRQDNTLKIDEQIFETERHFSPGRDVSMIGDEHARVLRLEVSEFSDDRLFASNAELSASRTSSYTSVPVRSIRRTMLRLFVQPMTNPKLHGDCLPRHCNASRI